MKVWYVFYMNNDGRQEIVQEDMIYTEAVKLAQRLTTASENRIHYKWEHN